MNKLKDQNIYLMISTYFIQQSSSPVQPISTDFALMYEHSSFDSTTFQITLLNSNLTQHLFIRKAITKEVWSNVDKSLVKFPNKACFAASSGLLLSSLSVIELGHIDCRFSIVLDEILKLFNNINCKFLVRALCRFGSVKFSRFFALFEDIKMFLA